MLRFLARTPLWAIAIGAGGLAWFSAPIPALPYVVFAAMIGLKLWDLLFPKPDPDRDLKAVAKALSLKQAYVADRRARLKRIVLCDGPRLVADSDGIERLEITLRNETSSRLRDVRLVLRYQRYPFPSANAYEDFRIAEPAFALAIAPGQTERFTLFDGRRGWRANTRPDATHQNRTVDLINAARHLSELDDSDLHTHLQIVLTDTGGKAGPVGLDLGSIALCDILDGAATLRKQPNFGEGLLKRFLDGVRTNNTDR